MASPLYMDDGPMSMQALIDSLQGRRRFPIDDPVSGYQPATDPDAKPPPYAPPQFVTAPRPGRTPQDMIDEAERAKSAFQPVKPNIPEQLGDIAAKTGQVGKAVATAPVNMVRNLYDKVAAQQAAERNPSASSDVYADPRAMAQDPEVPATALGLMGAGVPFAKAGTVGITGGKLVSSMAERNAAPTGFRKVTGAVESDPGYVYHATNSERAAQIAEEGKLKLHKPHEFTDQTVWPDGKVEKRNYFTTTAQNTWQFAPEEGHPTLLRVKKSEHPFQQESTGDIYSTKEVPADKLEFLHENGQWRPLKGGDVSGAPFYSAVEQALANAKLEKAPLDQWHNYLKGQPNVKAEELSQLGITPALPGAMPGSLTKAQLQEHLDANRVQLKEVYKGGKDINDETIGNRAAEIVSEEHPNIDPNSDEYYNHFEDAMQRAEDEMRGGIGGGGTATKFASYQLPGATNYGETLLTLPTKDQPLKVEVKQNQRGTGWEVFTNGQRTGAVINPPGMTLSEEQALQIGRQSAEQNFVGRKASEEGAYRSSHWDEPNVLAHVRHNDRNVPSPSGEGTVPSLHLEEVQSDWHQAGRKHGYATDAKNTDNEELYRQLGGTKPTPVPDALFKDTWPDLALKRMLHKAATETNPDGSFKYHAMSWTPGEAQAARYDLSKQVHEVNAVKYNDGTYGLTAVPKGQTLAVHLNNESIPEAKLADIIGKDLAEKIIKQEPGNYKKYSGVDLKVGGEGMKTFYDKMLVDKANALGKRYGARVGQAKTGPQTHAAIEKVGKNYAVNDPSDPNEYAGVFPTRELAEKFMLDKYGGNTSIHVLPITPELRAAAAKGFPLFALGAVAGPAIAQRQLPPMDDRAAKALATKPPDVGLGR